MPNFHRIASGPIAVMGLALALSACGDSTDDSQDAGVKDRDAGTGPADTGAGPTDTGTGPTDTGVMGPCNPVDGSGCPSGEFCVLSLDMDRGECRTLPAMNQFGEACSPQLRDCAPGLLCAQFMGDMGPTCHQACRSSGQDCADVPDTSSVYGCAVTSQGAMFGACRSSGGAACDPLAPNACGMGEVCSLVSQSDTACQPAGTAQLGGMCSAMNNCAEGQGMCIPLMSGTLCYEPCNPNMPSCSQPNYACQGLQGLSFGVCLPPQMGVCNPLTNPCPMGQVCSSNQAGNGVECVTEGSVALGGDCSAMNCARGGFCVPIQGGGRLCAQPCDLNMPMCPMGATCQNIGLDFGLCGG